MALALKTKELITNSLQRKVRAVEVAVITGT